MGFRLMQLAEFAIGICSCSIEIAQRHMSDPVRNLGVFEHSLNHELGVPIRIDWILRVHPP